jgi:uncharacterized protein (TIGR03118 family)
MLPAVPGEQASTPARPLGMLVPSLPDGLTYSAAYLRPDNLPAESACGRVLPAEILNDAWGVAVDASGRGFAADADAARVVRFFADTTATDGTERSISVPDGQPTGIAFAARRDFPAFGQSDTPFLLIATTQGTVSAWDETNGDRAEIVLDRRASGASFRGIAAGRGVSGPMVFVADAANGCVDRFDGRFRHLGSFTDESLPEGSIPLSIAWLDGEIFVTFARPEPEPGNGCVSVFSAEGRLLRALRTRSVFNSPSALVLSPGGFGAFGKHLLIGNHGDGTINAFDPVTGGFAGRLRDADGQPIALRRLRGLAFGPDPETLFVTVGAAKDAEGGLYSVTLRQHGPESEAVTESRVDRAKR